MWFFLLIYIAVSFVIRNIILLSHGILILRSGYDIFGGIDSSLMIRNFHKDFATRVLSGEPVQMIARHTVVLSGRSPDMSASDNTDMIPYRPPVFA